MNTTQEQLEQQLAESLRKRIDYYELSLETILRINQAVERNQDAEPFIHQLARFTDLARKEEQQSQEISSEFQRRQMKAGPGLQPLIDRAQQVLTQVVSNIDTVVQHAQQHKNALEPKVKVQSQATQMRSAYAAASKHA